jgi:DNA repair protein RadC
LVHCKTVQRQPAEFAEVKGLGPAKFTQLQAVMELARRAILEELQAGSMLSSPRAVKNICAPPLARKSFESFHVLFLDVKNRLIDAKEMFRGTLTIHPVYPREVVKEALARNAASVMLAHNHPARPTQRVRPAADTGADAGAGAGGYASSTILWWPDSRSTRLPSTANWVYPMRSRVYARIHNC